MMRRPKPHHRNVQKKKPATEFRLRPAASAMPTFGRRNPRLKKRDPSPQGLSGRRGDKIHRLQTDAGELRSFLVGAAPQDGIIPCSGSNIEILRPSCHSAFDMLVSEGEDLRRLPLSMRKTNLSRLLARRVVHLAPFEQGEIGPDLFRHACLMGLEGLVSKHGSALTAPAVSTAGSRSRTGSIPQWSA